MVARPDEPHPESIHGDRPIAIELGLEYSVRRVERLLGN